MCCCKSHLPHDETLKFMLLGDEEADKQIIFDNQQSREISLVQNMSAPQQKQQLDWKILTCDEHWLFERNFEVHQIVSFLFDKDQQFLAVTGSEGIGKGAIITKAVIFGIKRHQSIKSENVYRVDLDGIKETSQFLVRFGEAMKLSCQDFTEHSLVKEISKLDAFSLVYF